MARDYYGMLRRSTGRRPRRDQAGVPAARARAASGRQPRSRGRKSASPRSARPTRCCLIRRSAASSTSAAIRWATVARRRAAGVTRSAQFGFGDIMDAFFGGQGGGMGGRGPRPAQPRAARRRCAHPYVVDVGGVRHRRHPRAAPSRRRCCAPTAPARAVRRAARHCDAATSATAVARCRACSVRSSARSSRRACARQCRGFGEVIPDPCRRCQRRRPGPLAPRPFRVQHPPGRGRRHARAAGRAAVRSDRAAGPAGDLYVEVEEEPHELFTRDGADLHCTVASSR